MDMAMKRYDNCYKSENVKVEGRACKTNVPSNTAFRGFGGPQGVTIMEEIMFNVACNLGLSQEEVSYRGQNVPLMKSQNILQLGVGTYLSTKSKRTHYCAIMLIVGL